MNSAQRRSFAIWCICFSARQTSTRGLTYDFSMLSFHVSLRSSFPPRQSLLILRRGPSQLPFPPQSLPLHPFSRLVICPAVTSIPHPFKCLKRTPSSVADLHLRRPSYSSRKCQPGACWVSRAEASPPRHIGSLRQVGQYPRTPEASRRARFFNAGTSTAQTRDTFSTQRLECAPTPGPLPRAHPAARSSVNAWCALVLVLAL
ncbi:hypothetical protein B0H10DRAFT_1189346 [Mycena sp. CBHHK59/15]|nr:hypothetical protein B0H10DRAFT_1189346 [Mycena sp. CBHHK59/15]